MAYASDMHSGRFTLNREGPPGYDTFWVSNNIHNQLVTLGPKYDIIPDLAKSWDIIGKGKEYVFHLHENVKFHDGTDCDAEAVKWNFDDMVKRRKKSWVYVDFNQMEGAEVVDKHTVKVMMKEPAALLPALAGYFVAVPIGSPLSHNRRTPHGPRHDASPGPRRTLQRVNPHHVPFMERAKGVVLETAPARMPLVYFMNMRKPPFVMRFVGVILAFPFYLQAIVIMVVLGPSTTNAIIALSIERIPTFARLVRGSVLSVREHPYIEATRALAFAPIRILGRHVLPNCLVPIIVVAMFSTATAIIVEATLSFLGLGTQPPTVSWVWDLKQNLTFLEMNPWITIFPGLSILVTVLGFILLGDGLRDALDSRSKQLVGLQFARLLSSTIIIETLFGWPGIGLLLFEHINARDFPVLQAAVLLLAVFFVGMNLVVDLLYRLVNPRVELT